MDLNERMARTSRGPAGPAGHIYLVGSGEEMPLTTVPRVGIKLN